MNIFVFAEQFTNGAWDLWEHACSPKEVKTVVDSALARARARSLSRKPNQDDFLAGARTTFNIGQGPAGDPQDGDIRVYCVCVGRIVMGDYGKIRQYSQKIAENHQFTELALERSA